MNLHGAIAALLLVGPSYGYELVITLEAELGPLWSTRTSQVYLTLGRMERDGLVDPRRVRQVSRPDRHLLTLTPAGRRVAEAWLWEPSTADEIVVRLAVARLAIPDRFDALAETVVRERTVELHRLRAARRGIPGDEGFGQSALDREIRRTEADLRWATHIHDTSSAVVARTRARRRVGTRSAKLA